MIFLRLRILALAAAVAGPLLGTGGEPASAQNFPDRPVKVIVPFAPGGSLDVVARLVADRLSKTWSQPVVIENKPGANGIVGLNALTQSAADGYTILFATSPIFTVNKYLYKKLPYDPDKDLVPVSQAAVAPNVLGTYPKLPFADFQQLVAHARAHPNELTFASQGNGSTGELTGLLLDQMAGLKMRHIPYHGAALAWNDVIAGHVDMMWDGIPSVLSQIRAGTVRALEVRLTPEDRSVLEARVRALTTEQRDVFRARIVLLAAEGRSTRSIAQTVGTMPRTVSNWRGRFAREGLAGLADRPRPGPAPKYGSETARRILSVLEREPPAGFARWNGPLIAAELGDVHEQHVWRVLRAQKIDLAGRKSWCESDDPEFVAKAADVVGLSMAPPENAIVICVDEKPSIQALERAQGYLKLPNGRALTGHSHDYKRNGTTTLFAAFEVATGKVTASHKSRRRRIEFLDFMNDIVAGHPDTAIHVVLDNLNTHKPKNDRWLKRHPNVRFHFTPTRASWLNQVEIWFSILQGKSLRGASFTSVDQLRAHIDAFIEAYNDNAKPFVWTKTKVHQRRVKGRRISEL